MKSKVNKRIVVVAPHPDDEVLGCGGAIAWHASKNDLVDVIVVSKGAAGIFSAASVRKVRRELAESHRLLGVRKTHFLDFPAPRLDTVPSHLLADTLAGCIREIQPHTVYAPHWGDLHADHKSVYRATLVATRPTRGSNVQRLLCYETQSETEWGGISQEVAFSPTVFLDITEFLEIKLRAMKCYESQLKRFPETRSIESLEALARVRGSTVGFEAAEAFVLIRDMIS